MVAAARRQLEYVFYALRDRHVTADLRTPASAPPNQTESGTSEATTARPNALTS